MSKGTVVPIQKKSLMRITVLGHLTIKYCSFSSLFSVTFAGKDLYSNLNFRALCGGRKRIGSKVIQVPIDTLPCCNGGRGNIIASLRCTQRR